MLLAPLLHPLPLHTGALAAPSLGWGLEGVEGGGRVRDGDFGEGFLGVEAAQGPGEGLGGGGVVVLWGEVCEMGGLARVVRVGARGGVGVVVTTVLSVVLVLVLRLGLVTLVVLRRGLDLVKTAPLTVSLDGEKLIRLIAVADEHAALVVDVYKHSADGIAPLSRCWVRIRVFVRGPLCRNVPINRS